MIITCTDDKKILTWGNYIRVFKNCPYRNGWIMELQVPQSDWEDSKYDKYRS